MKTLISIIGMFLIGLGIYMGYINGFWSSKYFFVHHTSWLIILTQLIALFLAVSEYREWKNQAYSKSEHNNLVELYELANKLKISILEYDKTSRDKKRMSDLKGKFIQSKVKLHYELQTGLHDLYDNLILDVLVATESKINLISHLYNLQELHDRVNDLLKEAESRRISIMKLIEEESEENSDKRVNKIFKKIEDQIRKDSNILN